MNIFNIRAVDIFFIGAITSAAFGNSNEITTPAARYKTKIYGKESIFRHKLRDGLLGPEMILIPPGCLKDDPESEPHCVGEFALGRFEITRAEFHNFVLANGQAEKEITGREHLPINEISWTDAQEYAAWLAKQTGENYRLPTETEWEYAARAGTNRIWPWGNEWENSAASCRGCAGAWDFRGPAPIGTFAANPWGLHDLAGNLWEWTCSPFRTERNLFGWIKKIAPSDYAEKNNCSPAEKNHIWVMRGGSWFNLPEQLGISYRTGQDADYYYQTLGMRIAWQESNQPQTQLKIKVKPSDAQIILLNPERPGSDNLQLPTGTHHLRVERSGFIAFDQWVELTQPEQELQITLKSLAQWNAQALELENQAAKKYALNITLQPPNAKVILLSPIEQPYTTGMELPGGRYQIRVTAPGYETVEQIIELTQSGIAATITLPWIEPNTGMVFIHIPAGSFLMGTPETEINRNFDESPIHNVNLPSFLFGKYEVTFAQWDACVTARGCRYRPADQGWGRENRPVINISWYDAEEFVNWLSRKTGRKFRLPTEAEWEYAARAGTITNYWWGKTLESARANCHGCGSIWDNIQSAPVGSFPANPWGLFDTAGNVWEWLCSAYSNSYDGNENRCVGKENGNLRSLRGGSWYNLPHWMRSANRYRELPESRNSYTGFRIVGVL